MPTVHIPAVLVGDGVDVFFDEGIYSLDVIQRAAIKFTDLASFEITRPAVGQIKVATQLFADAGIPSAELGRILTNEVIDQALRERIADQTSAERNLILSYTFSRSKLVA